MFADYFKLAFTSLTKRRLRSWLTLLGICVGIATVVSLIGLGEGLREAITGQFNLVGNDVITITASGSGGGPPGSGVTNPLLDRDVEQLERINELKEVIGGTVETTQMFFKDDATVGFIRTIPGDDPDVFYDMQKIEIEEGRFIKQDEQTKIFIGHDYAEDEFDQPVQLGNKIEIEGRDFEVVGILKKQGSFITDGSIYMNDDIARELFDREDEVDIILAQVRDIGDLAVAKERIEKTLRDQRDVKIGEEDFEVETSETSTQSINDILIGVNYFVAALAAISIIVGGIGIANTMFTSVLERTNQIGIMKAIGATNKDIFFIFLVESGLLGSVGGIIGVILGITFANIGAFGANQAFGTELFNVNIDSTLILGAFIGSFLLGALAGVIPALRAANLRPVQALSYGK